MAGDMFSVVEAVSVVVSKDDALVVDVDKLSKFNDD